MPEVSRAEFDALHAQVADLLAARDRAVVLPARNPSPVQAQAESVQPFWDCVFIEGITLTAGAGQDWDALIDSQRASATYWQRFEAGEGGLGTFQVTQEGSFAALNVKRARFTWKPETSGTITASFSASLASGAGLYVQSKMNGLLTEHALSGPWYVKLSLQQIGGQTNTLIFTWREEVDEFYFHGRLIGRDARFVDPRSLDDYQP